MIPGGFPGGLRGDADKHLVKMGCLVPNTAYFCSGFGQIRSGLFPKKLKKVKKPSIWDDWERPEIVVKKYKFGAWGDVIFAWRFSISDLRKGAVAETAAAGCLGTPSPPPRNHRNGPLPPPEGERG